MVIDKEIHRELLLALFESVTINGSNIDIAYEVKNAIRTAKCFDTNLRDHREREAKGLDGSGDFGVV